MMDLFSSLSNGVHRVCEGKVVGIEETEAIDKRPKFTQPQEVNSMQVALCLPVTPY